MTTHARTDAARAEGWLASSEHGLPLSTRLAHIALAYGGIDNDITRTAKPGATPSARDFVFAKPTAQEISDKFSLDHDAGIRVHDIVTIEFNGQLEDRKFKALQMPSSIPSSLC